MALVQACTVGVFSGAAMNDGRPVIWKNRDATNPNEAVRYLTDGRFPYLALIEPGNTAQVWAGVNAAGFGIMNSNSDNMGGGDENGINDGILMKLALRTCAGIGDFQRLMDSLVPYGFAVPCNVGVLDSSGAAAFFETGPDFYVRVDADSQPQRYLLRATFSLCRDTAGQGSGSRYLRAVELVSQAAQQGPLALDFLIDQLSTDLGAVGFDPYPLPYRGAVGTLPPGFLWTSATINRQPTRAAIFIAGRRPGDPRSFPTMWTVLGQPAEGIAVPLWVGAHSVPDNLCDVPQSTICDSALALETRVYSDRALPYALNTTLLADADNRLDPVRSAIWEETGQQLQRWADSPPSVSDLADFEQRMADEAMAGYGPEIAVQEPTETPLKRRPDLQVYADWKCRVVNITVPGDPANRSLSILDVTGRIVAHFRLATPQYTAPGQSLIQWPAGRSPSGVYLVALDQGGRCETRTFALPR
jgi:hypothetical protein